MKRLFIATFFVLASLSTAWAQTKTVWNQPATDSGIYGDGYFNYAIDVMSVEMDDSETILRLKIMARPDSEHNKFQIMNTVYLLAGETRYKVRSIDGLKFDTWTNTDKDGKKDVAIHFEPLPLNTRSFDFIEFDGDGAWRIKGIKPVEERWKQLFPSYWRNEKTGDWSIAFLDNGYAIYDCKIWEMHADVSKADEARITLTQNGQNVDVQVDKDMNGKRNITIDGKKAVYSMITDRFMPDYPTKDTRTDFVDTDYKEDTITIAGWIMDMPEYFRNDMFFDISVENRIFLDETSEYNAKMDSLGRFSIKIPLLNSAEIFCDWKRCFIHTMFEPGKTYFLLYDFKEGRRFWMGDDVRLQNELLKFPLGWYGIRMDGGADFDKYISSVDSLIKAQHAYIDDLCRQHPNLSTRFCLYSKGNITWQQASYFGQARFNAKDFKLPENARKYAYDNFWSKMENPYTLHRDMGSFWDYYVGDLARDNESFSVNIIDCIDEIAENPEDLEQLKTWKTWIQDANEKMMALTNDEEKQKLADELNSQNKDMIERVGKILNSPRTNKIIMSKLHMKEIKRYMYCLDSLEADKTIKSAMIYRQSLEALEQDHTPMSANIMDSLKIWIDNPSLFENVEKKNEYYSALANKEFDKLVLKTGKEVEGMTEGKEILDKLLEPYRGKIVLIDFWGTWCGPCKEALSHSDDEYARLAKYDIQYVYLANSSPKDSWETIIKEYNVSGPNVAHFNLPANQQSAIERYLQIHAFPTYKLVDKQGNILDIVVNVHNLDSLESDIKILSEQ